MDHVIQIHARTVGSVQEKGQLTDASVWVDLLEITVKEVGFLKNVTFIDDTVI